LTADNTGKHTGGSISCPNCSTPMQEIRRYDADIDYCPSCKGVWLDRGEIDKMQWLKTKLTKNITAAITETEIMTITTTTITITEGIEGEEACLATYLTLTRLRQVIERLNI